MYIYFINYFCFSFCFFAAVCAAAAAAPQQQFACSFKGATPNTFAALFRSPFSCAYTSTNYAFCLGYAEGFAVSADIRNNKLIVPTSIIQTHCNTNNTFYIYNRHIYIYVYIIYIYTYIYIYIYICG